MRGSVTVSKEKQTSAMGFSQCQFLHGLMQQAGGNGISFEKDEERFPLPEAAGATTQLPEFHRLQTRSWKEFGTGPRELHARGGNYLTSERGQARNVLLQVGEKWVGGRSLRQRQEGDNAGGAAAGGGWQVLWGSRRRSLSNILFFPGNKKVQSTETEAGGGVRGVRRGVKQALGAERVGGVRPPASGLMN